MMVKKGQLILHSKPFAFKLSSKWLGMRCESCFNNKHPSLKKCTRCKFAFYCDKECQVAGWIDHKHECANIRRTCQGQNRPKSEELFDFVVLIARIIHKLRNGGDEKSETIGSVTRNFADLMSHSDEIMKDPIRSKWIKTVSVGLLFFMQEQIARGQVLTIAGKVIINALSIVDELTGEELGSAIYLGPSVLDHSCVPNAYYVYKGTDLIIRSGQDQEILDVSKMVVPYIDVLDLKEVRHKKLLEQYYFICDCVWCKDDVMDRQMMSMRCENLECDAPIYIHDDKCGKCDTSVNSRKQTEAIELIDHLRAACTIAKNLKKEKRVKDALYALYKVMKKAGLLLHPLNAAYVHGAETAADICLMDEDKRQAIIYSLATLQAYRAYYGHLSPMLAKLLMRIGRLQYFYGYCEEGRNHLQEAKDMLCTLYGEDNKLIEEMGESLQ